jgi:hypothetical protein
VCVLSRWIRFGLATIGFAGHSRNVTTSDAPRTSLRHVLSLLIPSVSSLTSIAPVFTLLLFGDCPISHSVSKPKLSYDRRSVGQSLVVSFHHLRAATNFSFNSIEIIFSHLGVCYYGAASLTRRRLCNLQLPLGLARAVSLASEFYVTQPYFPVSIFRHPQPRGPGSCIYFPQEQGGAVAPRVEVG